VNWKSFVLGSAVGLIAGYAVKETLSKRDVSAEKVLEHVKNEFKKHGPISGSWIHMEAETFEKLPITYRVYKGGISRNSSGLNEQFEFIADAQTGTLIDIHPITND
jgi:predicted small secreted protein